MILPILTVWGMYKAYPEILDDIQLPEGMDEDTMKDYIFMYAGDNEARYADPPLMERLVHRWFAGKKNDFQMMWNALHAEYNPIENTDRYEDFWENTDRTDKSVGKRTEDNTVERNSSSENSQSSDMTGDSEGHGSTTGESTRTPNLTNEETVSAFDSSDYQPSKKTAESGTEATESSETSESTSSSTQHAESSGSQSGSETETGKNVVDSSNDNTVHNELKHGLHSHGNIGVTTNQQMINEELELRVYDLYKTIALLFENEFTIPVYERRICGHGIL